MRQHLNYLVSIYSYLICKHKYLLVDYRKFSHIKTLKIEHQTKRTENNHYCLKIQIKSQGNEICLIYQFKSKTG